jgi:sugar/nucleoside kinase (ribokinase family)
VPPPPDLLHDFARIRKVASTAISLEAHAVIPISAHGAGDCFVGALTTRLAVGADLVGACRWANAAAALFVSSDDPAQARLGPGAVEAFLDRAVR